MIIYKIILLICIVSILLFIYNKYEINNKCLKNTLSKSVDIIIARYNEDLKWTLDYPFNKFKYIVYNKGNNDNFIKKNIKSVINLNNVGREGHTYLYHIVNNFNNLADINVFFPGSLEIKYKNKKAKRILNRILKYNQAFFITPVCPFINNIFNNYSYSVYNTSSIFNKSNNNNVTPAKFRPYNKWYEHHFNKKSNHNLSNLGIFSVHKNDIIQHPKSRYYNILKELSTSPNPEEGFFLEISIYPLFEPLNNTIIEVNYIDIINYIPAFSKLILPYINNI